MSTVARCFSGSARRLVASWFPSRPALGPRTTGEDPKLGDLLFNLPEE
jgi:hypothetical protein